MFDAEMPEFCTSTIIKARKAHECCECNRIINEGENYCHIKGKWNGQIYTYKQCAQCFKVAQSISDDLAFGYLEEYLMEEHPYNAKEYFALLKRGVFQQSYEKTIQEYKDGGYSFNKNGDPICDKKGKQKCNERNCYTCKRNKLRDWKKWCCKCGSKKLNWVRWE